MCVFISWDAYVEVGLLCAKYFEEPPACFYYSRGNTFFWSVDSHPFENVGSPLRWRHPRADEQGNVCAFTGNSGIQTLKRGMCVTALSTALRPSTSHTFVRRKETE